MAKLQIVWIPASAGMRALGEGAVGDLNNVAVKKLLNFFHTHDEIFGLPKATAGHCHMLLVLQRHFFAHECIDFFG